MTGIEKIKAKTAQALTYIGGSGIVNYYFPTWQQQRQPANTQNVQRNLNTYPALVQLQRLRQDVLSWRDAIRESEQAYYPQRVKMQRLFLDTVLNGHVEACIDRRRDLTLLRDFELCIGGKEDEKWTEYFRKQWFVSALTYILDATAYGYSLIAFGDLINDDFPDLTLVKRHNVSPDRKNVTSYVYSLSGVPFLDEPYADWHIWVPTVTENGISDCGNGYLYKVALYEIFLRNLLGFNGDFVELYAQPYRVGKTTKTEEAERAELEATLRAMGSSGYAIIDPEDSIEFLETALGGTGYQGYDNLEQRCEKKISKIILGHSDAMDSTPGKLGAGQKGEDSPVEKALKAKKTKDGIFCENVINNMIIPKLRNMGIPLPADIRFKFKNDEEKEEYRRKQDESNKITAEIAQTMSAAGMKMDPKYFTERTGIPCEIVEPQPQESQNGLTSDIKNKLDTLYKIK